MYYLLYYLILGCLVVKCWAVDKHCDKENCANVIETCEMNLNHGIVLKIMHKITVLPIPRHL